MEKTLLLDTDTLLSDVCWLCCLIKKCAICSAHEGLSLSFPAITDEVLKAKKRKDEEAKKMKLEGEPGPCHQFSSGGGTIGGLCSMMCYSTHNALCNINTYWWSAAEWW